MRRWGGSGRNRGYLYLWEVAISCTVIGAYLPSLALTAPLLALTVPLLILATSTSVANSPWFQSITIMFQQYLRVDVSRVRFFRIVETYRRCEWLVEKGLLRYHVSQQDFLTNAVCPTLKSFVYVYSRGYGGRNCVVCVGWIYVWSNLANTMRQRSCRPQMRLL